MRHIKSTVTWFIGLVSCDQHFLQRHNDVILTHALRSLGRALASFILLCKVNSVFQTQSYNFIIYGLTLILSDGKKE